jgi:hypothetical protein
MPQSGASKLPCAMRSNAMCGPFRAGILLEFPPPRALSTPRALPWACMCVALRAEIRDAQPFNWHLRIPEPLRVNHAP